MTDLSTIESMTIVLVILADHLIILIQDNTLILLHEVVLAHAFSFPLNGLDMTCNIREDVIRKDPPKDDDGRKDLLPGYLEMLCAYRHCCSISYTVTPLYDEMTAIRSSSLLDR